MPLWNRLWHEKRARDTGGMISDKTPKRSGPARPLISTKAATPDTTKGSPVPDHLKIWSPVTDGWQCYSPETIPTKNKSTKDNHP